MSNNIHDTDVKLIKKQVDTFLFDLEYYSKGNDTPSIDFFKKKFNYLLCTSKSLFNFIYTNYPKDNFSKSSFTDNVNKMLDYILQIQQGSISQYDASGHVGSLIGKQFIPQLKDGSGSGSGE